MKWLMILSVVMWSGLAQAADWSVEITNSSSGTVASISPQPFKDVDIPGLMGWACKLNKQKNEDLEPSRTLSCMHVDSGVGAVTAVACSQKWGVLTLGLDGKSKYSLIVRCKSL